jgi:hypothetical protein
MLEELKKRLDKKKHKLEIKKQSLHLSVVYESNFLNQLGRRGLLELRDELLDNINLLTKEIEDLEKEINR